MRRDTFFIIFVLALAVMAVSSCESHAYGRSVNMSMAFHIGTSKVNDEISRNDTYIIANDSIAVGMVFSGSSDFGTSINTVYSAGDNMLNMEQSLGDGRFYIVYTKGNFSTIKDKVSQVSRGKLLAKMFGSYQYPAPSSFPTFLRLEYDSIDILNRTSIARGTLVIRNEGRDERGLWRISMGMA